MFPYLEESSRFKKVSMIIVLTVGCHSMASTDINLQQRVKNEDTIEEKSSDKCLIFLEKRLLNSSLSPEVQGVKWTSKQGIQQVAIPLDQLFKGGMAHIPIPAHFIEYFSSAGEGARWLSEVRNRQYLQTRGSTLQQYYVIKKKLDELDRYFFSELQRYFPSIEFISSSSSIIKVNPRGGILDGKEGESSNFHYDLPPNFGASNPNKFDAWERADPVNRAFIAATVVLPLDMQPTSVAVPWGGKYQGQSVQGPPFHITVLLVNTTWHRGDSLLHEDPNDSHRGLMRFGAQVVNDLRPDWNDRQLGRSKNEIKKLNDSLPAPNSDHQRRINKQILDLFKRGLIN